MGYSGWAASNCLRCGSAVVSSLPLSISAIVKPTALGSEARLVVILNSASGNNTNFWALNASSGGGAMAHVGDNAGTTAWDTTTDVMSNDNWYQAGAMFTSSTSRHAILDGVKGAGSTTSKSPTGVNRTSIGLQDNTANSKAFTGTICEVGIWNVALTNAEWAMLGAKISPLRVRPQSLVAYWPIYGLSTEPNLLSASATMALVGSLTVADSYPIIRPRTRRGPNNV